MEVTKSQYARMRDRAPSAVSNWIAANKLTAPALVMRAGKELIDVDLADQQLARTLDPSQQLAREPSLPTAPTKPADTGDTARYLKAKADEKELDTEARRRKLQLETGAYVLRANAELDFKRALASIFTDLDSWVVAAGEALAGEFGIDQRAATLKIRSSLNAFRAQQSKKRAELGQAMPETVPELQAAE